MAEEEIETEVVEEESGGGIMKKMIFAGIGLVLVAGGIFVGPAIMNMIAPPPQAEGTEVDNDQTEPSRSPALYTSLHPPLVVNFKDSVGDAHFMQITMEAMAREQEVINAVREHTPVIRNNLILLYGNAIYEDVTTRAGKEKMLADGLAEIQMIMSEQIGEPGVEAVYFTSLIIQ